MNTFPGLVHTARHTTRVMCTRSGFVSYEGVLGKEGEVVTR